MALSREVISDPSEVEPARPSTTRLPRSQGNRAARVGDGNASELGAGSQ